jgi:hypothetical protein
MKIQVNITDEELKDIQKLLKFKRNRYIRNDTDINSAVAWYLNLPNGINQSDFSVIVLKK